MRRPRLDSCPDVDEVLRYNGHEEVLEARREAALSAAMMKSSERTRRELVADAATDRHEIRLAIGSMLFIVLLAFALGWWSR